MSTNYIIKILVIVLFAVRLAALTLIGGEVSEELKAKWEAERKQVEVWNHANETGICELHHTNMQSRVVEIIYGLPGSDATDIPSDVQWRLFPHAQEVAFGGCMVSSNSPKTRKIYICPDCKQAERKWRETRKTQT